MIQKTLTETLSNVADADATTADVFRLTDEAVHCNLITDTGETIARNRIYPPNATPFTFTDVERDVLNDAVAAKIDSYLDADLKELYSIYDTADETLIAGFYEMKKAEKLDALKEELNLA